MKQKSAEMKKQRKMKSKPHNSLDPEMFRLVKALYVTLKTIFPNYPWYTFPSVLLIELFKRSIKIAANQKLKLVPIPNALYELLMKNEFLKSEHIAFACEDIFYNYVESRELNFVNVTVSAQRSLAGAKESSEADVLRQILNITPHTIVMQLLPVTNCQKNCIYVKENFYANMMERFKSETNFCIRLERHGENQPIPEIATKAQIYMLNNPYELPSDVTDSIFENFFTTPRILHRNYTYRIEINEKLLGISTYSKYYNIFAYLDAIYFRCVQLETKANEFEMQSVVAKNFTNLVQTTASTKHYLPRQILDNVAIVENYPIGLSKYYNLLKKSINAFLPKDSATCLSSKHIFPMFLLQGDRGSGKTKLINSLAQELGLHLFGVDCAEIVSQVSTHTELKLKAVFCKSIICEPLLICFHNFEIFGVDNEGNEDLRLLASFQVQIQELYNKQRAYPIVVVALTNERELKPMIQRLFLEVITLQMPSKEERFDILKWLHIQQTFNEEIFNKTNIDHVPLFSLNVREMFLKRFFNWKSAKEVLQYVAEKSQGFVLGDLNLLYEKSIQDMKSEKFSSGLRYEHFDKSLNIMQTSFADSLGSPKVPKVLWSDIGGLAKIKEEIQSSIGLPLKYVHLMSKNLRRSGILLYGPPGTGKTLVAKAVATESNLSFLSVQGPELLNMYVGQSEKNVREVFFRARSAAPCVLFLDELDSLAPNRGAAGDSGGVMDRVVSQLLAEMDGMNDESKQIFILAATNRPDLIDSALLRPGRFDKMFYIGPCSEKEEKVAVLKTQLKNFKLQKGLKIDDIAEMFQNDMTGADLYSICSNAWLSAVRRIIDENRKGKIPNDELSADKVIVQNEDFVVACQKFVPSISPKDLEYFKRLKINYS